MKSLKKNIKKREPVINWNSCRQCLMCYPVCAHGAIEIRDGKRLDINYDRCRRCGICVKACPFKSIDMI